MFNTADYSYILPTHRATVYVIGIAMGFILRQLGRDVKLKKVIFNTIYFLTKFNSAVIQINILFLFLFFKAHLTLGWLIALSLLYFSIVHPSKMGDRSYVYDQMDAANYSAFAPITWCFFFAWVIFTSHTGNGGNLDVLTFEIFRLFFRT